MPLQPQAVLEKSEVRKCKSQPKKCNVALFACIALFNFLNWLLHFLTFAEIYDIFYRNVFVTSEKNKVQVSKKHAFKKRAFLSAVNFLSVTDFNDRNYKLLIDYSAKKAIVTNSIPPKTD